MKVNQSYSGEKKESLKNQNEDLKGDPHNQNIFTENSLNQELYTHFTFSKPERKINIRILILYLIQKTTFAVQYKLI